MVNEFKPRIYILHPQTRCTCVHARGFTARAVRRWPAFSKKPYRCTMFALVKILFKFYNNCKYSFYNLPGKFENSSYKSSLLHALRAVYYD